MQPVKTRPTKVDWRTPSHWRRHPRWRSGCPHTHQPRHSCAQTIDSNQKGQADGHRGKTGILDGCKPMVTKPFFWSCVTPRTRERSRLAFLGPHPLCAAQSTLGRKGHLIPVAIDAVVRHNPRVESSQGWSIQREPSRHSRTGTSSPRRSRYR